MARSVRDVYPPQMDVASALALAFAQAGLGGEDGSARDRAVSHASQSLLSQELTTVADLRLALHCERERRLAEVTEFLGSEVEKDVSDALMAFLDALFSVDIAEYALPAKKMKRVGEVKLLFGSVCQLDLQRRCDGLCRLRLFRGLRRSLHRPRRVQR